MTFLQTEPCLHGLDYLVIVEPDRHYSGVIRVSQRPLIGLQRRLTLAIHSFLCAHRIEVYDDLDT